MSGPREKGAANRPPLLETRLKYDCCKPANTCACEALRALNQGYPCILLVVTQQGQDQDYGSWGSFVPSVAN